MDAVDESPVEKHSLSDLETASVETLIDRRHPTPLPKLQIGILLALQLAEPISSSLIYPFINQLIQELGVTQGDDRKVGYYAGVVESIFFIAEAACVFQWGQASDRVGRKPVLLLGILGLIISMTCFGFSHTFLAVVASRAFAGATNGNIGVVKSMMGELTDPSNVAQGFALMPIIWSVGSAIGPFLGGSLSHPHERFPSLFGGNTFWKDNPYMLPCLVASSYSVCSLIVAGLFLRETRQKKGQYRLLNNETEERYPLSNIPESPDTPTTPKFDFEPPPTLRSILSGPLFTIILNYNTLALTDIGYAVLQPLFLAYPIPDGGLGLQPWAIGVCLGLFSIVNGCVQATCFPALHRRYGSRKIFTLGVMCLTLEFFTFPAMSWLTMRAGHVTFAVWTILALQYLLAMPIAMAYGTVNIFITTTASPVALGATNGVSQTTTSCMRAIGPALATSLFSLSVQWNLAGGWLVYWVLATMGMGCIYCSTFLPSDHAKQKY